MSAECCRKHFIAAGNRGPLSKEYSVVALLLTAETTQKVSVLVFRHIGTESLHQCITEQQESKPGGKIQCIAIQQLTIISYHNHNIQVTSHINNSLRILTY